MNAPVDKKQGTVSYGNVLAIMETFAKKVAVQLWGASQALLGQSGADPLSIHRRERVVIAALWNQPDALPTTLRLKKPKSLRSGPLMQLSTWIGRASLTPDKPLLGAPPKSNHLGAPLGDRLS